MSLSAWNLLLSFLCGGLAALSMMEFMLAAQADEIPRLLLGFSGWLVGFMGLTQCIRWRRKRHG